VKHWVISAILPGFGQDQSAISIGFARPSLTQPMVPMQFSGNYFGPSDLLPERLVSAWGNAMDKRAEYRRNAAACLRLAAEMTDARNKGDLIEMADGNRYSITSVTCTSR
jgi:hypothetical protein